MIQSDDLYTRAFGFAMRAHAGQFRKYTNAPYFDHCVEVARLVSDRTADREIWAAAILHDVIEDTDAKASDLAERFGNRVLSLVAEVTDVYTKQAYPDLNRFVRKRREAERLGRISDEAKLIKLCDLQDNMTSIVRYDPDFAVTYLREKADVLEAMGYGK